MIAPAEGVRPLAYPVACLRTDSVTTPALDALAQKVQDAVTRRGVGWVGGFGRLGERALRLAHRKMGLWFGPTVDTYGRLYDVRDSGASYREKAIPVS